MPYIFTSSRPARDRWSVLLRPILVIPHAILVGGPFVGFGGGCSERAPWACSR